MTAPNNILVVVDPTSDDQPAVERGAELARKLGWSLELLICHYEPGLAAVGLLGTIKPEELRELALARQVGLLNALARKYGDDELKISTKAVWDTPLYEGIIREALRRQPRLVMKDTHYHSAISRTLLTNTDWHLIRDCPMPLWLVKSDRMASPTVLAAVDPLHEHDKPAALDGRILAEAKTFAELLGGELHVFHGYDTAPALASISGGPIGSPAGPLPVADIIENMDKEHRTALLELTRQHDIPQERVHLEQGAVVATLCSTASELTAGVVVMGAVSRSLIQRATIGSLAEQALDRLPCDVLIVKNKGFESEVMYKPQPASFQQAVNN